MHEFEEEFALDDEELDDDAELDVPTDEELEAEDEELDAPDGLGDDEEDL